MTTPMVDGVPVALPPPEDYVVDFENPKRQSETETYIVAGVGMTLAFLFMCQRLYVKTFIRNKLGYDDALLVVAWLGTVAIQAIIIRSFMRVTMGVHGWEIPFENFQEFNLFGGYVNSIIYVVPTALSKIVILLFYQDINNPQTWYRWSTYSVMFVVGGSGIGILFSSIFPCQPVAKSWDLSLAEVGSCIDRPAMYQATAALGVATDVLILAIPIPMVIGLHTSKVKKIGLLGMFSIGSATVITSMVRLWLLIKSLDEVDQTWGGGPVSLWICVEANLLIMCASLSTLRHFLKVVAPRLMSSTDPSSKQASKGISSNNELRTFGAGSSRGRAHYNRFDDTMALDTVDEQHLEQGKVPTRHADSPEGHSMHDGRSDTAILPVARVNEAKDGGVADVRHFR